MADDGLDRDGLARAIEQLAAASAVVRFADGVVRVSAVDPSDADERVVVRLRPTDENWASAFVAVSELLTNDLRAASARRSLRVVR